MLEPFPIFHSLDKEHLDQLERRVQQILAEKGTILFTQGDETQGFYAVVAGNVRVFRVSSKGKEITQRIVGAGGTFAEASIFSDTYRCNAEALKDSSVFLIPKEPVLQAIESTSRFAAAWIRILSNKVLKLCHRIEELSLKTPKERIASYLLLLSDLQNTAIVKLPVHRKSIATLLGMTHETFYRTTKGLEEENLLQFDKLQVEILSRSMLEDMIEGK